MKTTKIRSGLYETEEFEINEYVSVTFSVEKNEGDFYGRELDRWQVTQEIGGNESELWDEDFNTKKEAVIAIEETIQNGKFVYYTGLGWCYIPS